MRPCASCGAGIPADAAWCGQCYAAAAQPVPGPVPGGRPVPVAEPRIVLRTTRWGKTPTTFGPVGRVLATVGVLLPLVIMVVGGFVVLVSWGGAVVYAGALVPRAMRDIWAAGRIPL